MMANSYGRLMNASFIIVFSLLASGFLVMVDCPYCGGTGHIEIGGGSSSQELKAVVARTNFAVIRRGCDFASFYKATVYVTLSNEGKANWSGTVEVRVVEAKTGRLVSSKYVGVELGGGSTKPYSFDVMVDISALRREGFRESPDFETSIQPVHGIIPCPVCGGAGKINVFSWLVPVKKGEGPPQLVEVQR